MQTISLYWFAAQQQTSTLTQQKSRFFTRNLVQNLMKLVFFSATGRGQKTTKTKVVQKNTNRRHLETKG